MTLHLALLFAVVAVAPDGESQTDIPANTRRYDGSPLTGDDFLAKPDRERRLKDGVLLTAYTTTEIRYEYRFEATGQPDHTSIKLSNIDVYSVVHRDRSWNVDKSNQQLLRHEQGHWDLTEAYARRLQLGFLTMFERGDAPEATGEDQPQAAEKLKRQIRQIVDKEQATLQPAHDAYDRVTNRGLRMGPQTAAQEKQVVVLRDLARQLEAFRDVAEHEDETSR